MLVVPVRMVSVQQRIRSHAAVTAAFFLAAAAVCTAAAAALAAVLSGLEEVSSSLEVSMSDALNLVTQQPTLLLAKVKCDPPVWQRCV